jgi:hypothetical protein
LFIKHDSLTYFLYCKFFYLTVPAVFVPTTAPNAATGGAQFAPNIEPTAPPKSAPNEQQTPVPTVVPLGLGSDAISVNKQIFKIMDMKL